MHLQSLQETGPVPRHRHEVGPAHARFRDLPLAHNRKEDKLFYDVVLDNGSKGTIIDFYNRIYISNMNQFLAEISKMTFQDLTSIRFSNRRRHFGER